MSVLSNTDARKLDQRILFQNKHEARTPSGAFSYNWSNFADCWASVDAVRANERFTAEQEINGNEYTVWIRWRGDLDTNMRILWKGKVLDIKGIPDNQRRGRFLAIFAEEGKNSG